MEETLKKKSSGGKPGKNKLWWPAFASAYLKLRVATDAYQEVHPKAKRATARNLSYKTLHDPEFAPYLERAKEDAAKFINLDQISWAEKLRQLWSRPIKDADEIKLLIMVGKINGIIKEDVMAGAQNFNTLVLAQMEAVKRIQEQRVLENKVIDVEEMVNAEILPE